MGPPAPAPQRQPHHTLPSRRRPYPAGSTNVLVDAYPALTPLRSSTATSYPPTVPSGLHLCYVDAYAQRTSARVVAVSKDEPALVTLDQTVFYPGGGGQPADRGTVRRTSDGAAWGVGSARKIGGEIVHALEAGATPPAVGDEVDVDI